MVIKHQLRSAVRAHTSAATIADRSIPVSRAEGWSDPSVRTTSGWTRSPRVGRHSKGRATVPRLCDAVGMDWPRRSGERC